MKQQLVQLLVAFLCIGLAAQIFFAISGLVSYLKMHTVRRNREGKGFTRERFVSSFRAFGVPDKIPATVFDYYTSSGIWKNFPLCPDDTYSQILWDDPDDIDEDALALVEQLQMRFPPERILREYDDKSLVTLRDMVLWLNWIRQHQSEPS